MDPEIGSIGVEENSFLHFTIGVSGRCRVPRRGETILTRTTRTSLSETPDAHRPRKPTLRLPRS